MADAIRLVDYFYIELSGRRGAGARALGVLKEAGVHLNVFHAFPGGWRAQLDFVASDLGVFKAAAKVAKWKITGPKKAFVIEGEDRTSALVDYFAKLGDTRINVTATSAIASGTGRFGAILWVKPRDVKLATTALGIG